MGCVTYSEWIRKRHTHTHIEQERERERGMVIACVCAVESFHWNNAPYFMNKPFKRMETDGEEKT